MSNSALFAKGDVAAIIRFVLYKEIHPGSLLSPYIRCFWILEGEGGERSVERVLPDGSPEIVIHYGEPFERWRNDIHQWEKQQSFLLVGQATASIQLRPGRRTGVIGVRFRPYGAAAFLNLPMAEFTNQILSSSDLASPVYKDMAQRIARARNNVERIRVLESCLGNAFRKEPDPLVASVVSCIEKHPDAITVWQLSKEFHTTERSLQRRFHDSIGVSPKQFASILRFQRVLKMLQSGRDLSLTQIAQDFGFFDQSHFIHEFKTFASVPPSHYVKELHELSDHFISN